MPELRRYQRDAIEAIRAQLRTGRRRVLLISPTGSGKSLLIASMVQGAKAKGKRSLYIVHRRELVTQISERLTRDGVTHGIMMGKDSRGASEPVQVCSVQTLSRRAHPPADLILVDEAHRAAADTYLAVFAKYPGAPVIGYTATPNRTDGRGLGDLFESAVVAATPAELIRDGFLCRYSGFAFMAPDLEGVRTVAGDWDGKGLTLAYQKSTIYASVTEKWLEKAHGRQTIVFASSIEASLDIVARFRAVGVTAEHIDYKSPSEERASVIARVRDGSLTVVSNVNLLSEGTDLPSLAVAVLARPTKSLTMHLQQLGRVLRVKPDGSAALILDHSGNCARHGLPDSDRSWELTKDKPREVVPSLFTCTQCFAIGEHPPCSECGHQPATVARSGPVQQDEHVEVDIRKVRRIDKKRRDELVRLLASDARRHGMAPGWVVRKLNEKMPGASFPAGWWRANVAGEKGNWRWA